MVNRRFRLVCAFNSESGKYHTYLTNIPVEILAAEDIARLYAARWEIELIFKELKSHYRMDLIPSANPRGREMLDLDRYSDVNVLTQDTPADSECKSRKC